MTALAALLLGLFCVGTAAGVARYDEPHFAALVVPPLLLSACVLFLVALELAS
jgi:hypothetical protein